MLIESIAKNCPKIERLSTHLEIKDFTRVKSLLLNCRNLVHLEFESLNFVINENNVGDELLDVLTNFSPDSLVNIKISGDWKYSIDAFERFFESCRGRTLLFFNTSKFDYLTKDHKIVVRKYINEGVIKVSNCV